MKISFKNRINRLNEQPTTPMNISSFCNKKFTSSLPQNSINFKSTTPRACQAYTLDNNSPRFILLPFQSAYFKTKQSTQLLRGPNQRTNRSITRLSHFLSYINKLKWYEFKLLMWRRHLPSSKNRGKYFPNVSKTNLPRGLGLGVSADENKSRARPFPQNQTSERWGKKNLEENVIKSSLTSFHLFATHTPPPNHPLRNSSFLPQIQWWSFASRKSSLPNNSITLRDRFSSTRGFQVGKVHPHFHTRLPLLTNALLVLCGVGESAPKKLLPGLKVWNVPVTSSRAPPGWLAGWLTSKQMQIYSYNVSFEA